MITPPPVKPNSKIRIVSPSGKIDEKHVMPAVGWLEKQGYKVELGEHVFAKHFQFAGTDEQRLKDVQTALDDPDCDAIICSRGGYGTVRIISKLDFTAFTESPKWLVGFSDITILHSCLNKLEIATVHGVMPRYFFNEAGEPKEDLTSMMKLITGEGINYSVDTTEYSRNGKANAELIGGNLSIVTSLQGTKYDLNTDGKILFLEDIDEFLYHTDRMIHQLKLSGKLDKLAGLILGDFTDMKDNESPFGKTVHEIILEAVADFDYPVCFDFPGGHDKKNLALAFGKQWELDVSSDKTTLNFTP
ncbi:LD-carboxypeptidase [Prolixibacteraceae bacterium Z1-6]|uniref:LD-carboxypeptidase n=1 Tax=Draconibacterium aestuarii TaxID=2998507 RepID=A0A9X3FDI5_9BACT|nr:LD-carboxypeptidase [Prolixibacteraceae bacterium Z1-6]